MYASNLANKPSPQHHCIMTGELVIPTLCLLLAPFVEQKPNIQGLNIRTYEESVMSYYLFELVMSVLIRGETTGPMSKPGWLI
jgi:hypothetical protein